MDTDSDTAINNILASDLANINAAIPSYVVSNGYDPLQTVASGSDTLGKIKLGLCTASVKAAYSISNLCGLSSLQIETLTVETLDAAGATGLSGTLTLSATLTSSLSASVGGSIKASACGITEKVGLSGSVVASAVTATGVATFSASMANGAMAVDDISLGTLTMSYGSISVHVNGLGVFNSFAGDLDKAISSLFGNYITDTLAGLVTGLLNEIFQDII